MNTKPRTNLLGKVMGIFPGHIRETFQDIAEAKDSIERRRFHGDLVQKVTACRTMGSE